MNISWIFEKYGRGCTLGSDDEAFTAKMNAFISPLRYKNKMYLYGVNTEIGYNSEGYYLYIGPPEPDITEADRGTYIVCGGEKYRIDRAEKVFAAKSPFYIWAIIRKMTEDEE